MFKNYMRFAMHELYFFDFFFNNNVCYSKKADNVTVPKWDAVIHNFVELEEYLELFLININFIMQTVIKYCAFS